jgi:hypothetical protein
MKLTHKPHDLQTTPTRINCQTRAAGSVQPSLRWGRATSSASDSKSTIGSESQTRTVQIDRKRIQAQI